MDTSFIRLAIVTYLIINIGTTIIESHREILEMAWDIWRRFRIRIFLESLAIITAMMTALVLLWNIPLLRFGWTNLLYEHGGNILFSPALEGIGAGNINIRIGAIAFLAVMLILIPALSIAEENMFRTGHLGIGSTLVQSVKFGLVHCLVGIPLAAGIALIVPGFFFARKYERAYRNALRKNTQGQRRPDSIATIESATYHAMYNTIILCGLVTVLALS